MTDNALGDDVKHAAQRYLPSINHLNALMCLHEAGGAVVSPEAVAETLNTDVETGRTVMSDLVRAQLVESAPDGGARLDPADHARASLVALIVDANSRFPVQLIRAIYERPASAVQAFADAFRLRKDP